MMPSSGEDILRTTGGQVDSIVLALIDATFDKNDGVSMAICNSLFNIGKHQPNLVLSSCHSYLQRHPKLPLAHKILVLGVIERVCSDVLDLVEKNVALDLIKQAAEEMVNTKEVVPEWQNVASGILVSLGRKFHNEVMEVLLMKFQPGILPHFFVVQTMANLASANVFGMVPFLKAILGTMLPLLGMVKQENMKWIFACALAHFSEAVLEYIANVEKAPDPTVKKEVFVSEISSAYDVLFSNWLQSREAKVRAEVVEALGHMTHLLSPEKLEELLPKVIPSILAMYKKHQEYQHTTQGLCMVLDAAISNKSITLEMQLDNIFNALFPQVCKLPDYSQPSGVKNHNEVLRCFAVLAPVYSDRLISFLLQRLDNSNERSRIGALTILKHLINSCDLHLVDKMPHILAGLKLVLDSVNKVKKVIAQVIVALAHHGHLEIEGGRDMVWFIIGQCALPDDNITKRPNDADYVSNEALRGMCENVMHLLTTTVEKMENVLWPDLLDCLMTDNLTSAVGPVCKSLAHFAGKKREELGQSFDIDYKRLANIPKPQTLLARLLVLLGHPHDGKNRGVHILRLLKAISPLISKNVMALWDTKIPCLIQQLKAVDDLSEWDQKQWENDIAEFLIHSLEEIDKEEWTLKLGKALQGQFILYTNSSEDKYMLLRTLGIIMKKTGSKNFIIQVLDSIFDHVHHSSAIERQGCAMAVGYCGASHLDAVLVKLEQVAKDDRKNASLFSFIKEFKGDSEHDKLKATIILCYGFVTMHGPVPILSTRIETPILRSVANYYQSTKDTMVKQSMLQTVKLIAEAVHPSHLNETFVLRSRNELLNLMKTILKAESATPLTNSVRSLALSAAASLVALDPTLLLEEKTSLIETSVNAVYSLPRDCLMHRPRDEITEDMDFDQLLFSTVDSLNLLLKQLLLKEKTHHNLEVMFQILQVWMISKHDIERERCMHSALHLLQSYFHGTENDPYSPFNTLGTILGILIPRCTDPQVTVGHLAFDCIDTVLAVAFKTQSKIGEERIEISLENLKQQVINDDPSSLFTVTKDLGKLISEKLPVDQICPFLKSLINGLCDPHSQSSSGASVVLNTTLKLRGREIRQEIPVVLQDLRDKLQLIKCPHTRKNALRSIQHMASHHISAILSSLLSSPLPFDIHTTDSWKTLAQDKNLGNHIVEHCLELLSDNTLVNQPDPHGRKDTVQIAMLKPLVAVCALREMFRVAEMESCAIENFDKIFATLLLVAGTYVGVSCPSSTDELAKGSSLTFSRNVPDQKMSKLSPIRCATEALKIFLICAKQDIIVSLMTDGGYWLIMEDEDKYPETVAALTSFLCSYCPSYIPKIVAFLNPMLSSSVEVQRIVAVAMFAELLSQQYEGGSTLTEPLMNNLLGRLVDSCHIVRKLCIRGLGYIGKLEMHQVQRFSTTILSAMMAGMDDKDDPGSDITLEAMSGLSSILSQVAEEDVRGILINIALRIRPMFDKEKAPVRTAAFTLFGNLSRFGNGPSKEPFMEQIHNNLVTLLLHLNDEDKHVVKSCKYALRLLGPLLQSQDINAMFQKHLLDDAHLHYGEFINDLTKAVINDFPDKINFYVTTSLSYLKSSFPIIQCNAAALLGFFLGNLPNEKHSTVSQERACSALVLLLKDQTPEVRIRAAEALSLMHNY